MDAVITKPQTKPAQEASPIGMRIAVTENGPYLVTGGVPLSMEAITPVGGHREYQTVRTFPPQDTYALCRCGRTSTPPYCDGSHAVTQFDGTETASREPYEERADIYPGDGVTLFDDNRCAYARFCHREDGDVWTLTGLSDNPRLKREAIHESTDCPTGRLTHVDTESGAVYESKFEPSIVLLEDREQGVSGPLFVRGGITLVAADGSEYELRNRYALCRCGESRDKPFCDAMHVTVRYNDGSATQ